MSVPHRLQISTSVGSIVGSLAAGTHVLCVNYSAADGVIFCCAGLASAAKVAPEDFDSALPGSWVVEKVPRFTLICFLLILSLIIHIVVCLLSF
jgi:glyoxylate carboligase